MKVLDIVEMAFHNLWSRKLRTIMNLLGIVLGCVVLLLTLSGTRGVENSINALVEGSADAKRFMIYNHYQTTAEPPYEALVVHGTMPEERRDRIQKRLKRQWLNENAPRTMLGEAELKKLSQIPHLTELVPKSHLSGTFALESTEPNDFQAIGISLDDENLHKQTYFGKHLQPDDSQGVLLNEFTAYKLGFATDEELQSLIGKTVTFEIQTKGQQLSSFVAMSNWNRDEKIDATESMAAMHQLVTSLDSLPISGTEKSLIKELFKIPDEAEENTALYETKQFIIRGVFRPPAKDGSLLSMLRNVGYDSGADFYLPHPVATKLQLSGDQFSTFHSAVGTVDELANLEAVIKEIEAEGFGTHSSLWFVKRFESDVRNARLAISALSLLILIIAAIGISNTMVVSVLERVGEFGILKAIGARDRHVMLLMLVEGLLTGLLGALASIIAATSLSHFATYFVQRHLTQQLRHEYSENVFSFSSSDMAIVLVVAMLTCGFASLFPAWRAAKLDPVVAMRKN